MAYPRAKTKTSVGTNNKIIDKNCSDIGLCLQFPPWQSQGSLFCLLLCRNRENPWYVFKAKTVNISQYS